MTRSTKTVGPIDADKLRDAQRALDLLVSNPRMIDQAIRIEIDIEYTDGGRVKVEARA